ncbi:MAG TPA: hypothetical protein DCM28_13740 [Phycisphaerales bacterium]|nr:hypothetical protein [Phycisphaerales bacterium]|tara:strand:+ start:465 stop:1040 length:576 start_codon:yes stop_codon:yes gene_type:complete
MRVKDQAKESRILKATRDLVNEIGFKAASMSKIAKAADVSPATIYLYFPNQEALFIENYIQSKRIMADDLFGKDDLSTFTVKDATEHLWQGYFKFMRKKGDIYSYYTHFSSSPYITSVDCRDIDPRFEQLFEVVQRGIDQGIFRPLHWTMYWANLIGPIERLYRDASIFHFKIDKNVQQSAFEMAWKSLTI